MAKLLGVVPRAGFEPARAEAQRILSPSRLPVPPPRRSRKVMNLALRSQRVRNIVNIGKS